VVRNLRFYLAHSRLCVLLSAKRATLSLIEKERKSSILICSLLCPGAFPEIRCKCDDFSFLAIGIATGFHKIYTSRYLVLDSIHTIAHGVLKTTSIDKTALFSLSS